MSQQIPFEAFPLIKAFEGCLKPVGQGNFTTYLCPANVLTIGWGSTRHDVPSLQPGEIWTKTKCDEVFQSSLSKKYLPIVFRWEVQAAKPLTSYQRAALLSLVYNCGEGALRGNVGRALKEGRYDEVPSYMARWNKGGGRVLAGLVRRRKAEGLLWEGNLEGASKVAGTVIAGSVARTREVPVPTTRELARQTPGLAAGTGTGTATSAGTAGQSKPTEGIGMTEGALMGLGLALALVCGVVMLKKWGELRKDWA